MPKIGWRHYAEDEMAPLRRRFTRTLRAVVDILLKTLDTDLAAL